MGDATLSARETRLPASGVLHRWRGGRGGEDGGPNGTRMELREYWHIIWSRRLMIGALLLVTLVVSVVLTYGRPPTYETELRILVKPILSDATDTGYYSREYYRTLFAEYVQDDLSEVIKSRQFAEDVAEQIQTRYGAARGIGEIVGGVRDPQGASRRADHGCPRSARVIPSGSERRRREVLQTVGWQYVSPEGPSPGGGAGH